ncbi:glycosyltransferase family 4 protein [bacterium]|nr:glycosyltransferase family 4 protein [bacterium]
MRVLVDGMLLGDRPSGVEVSIEGLCRGLGAQIGAHEFMVVHRPSYQAEALQGPVLTTHAAPGWTCSRAGRILWEQSALSRFARRWGARVLHAPGYVMPLFWRGGSVLTVYDVLALSHPEWCKRSNVWHYRRALPVSLRRATVVVVPSEVVRREVVACAPIEAGKVRVIPLGLGDQFAPVEEGTVARARELYQLQKPYLLWVGNLEPKKNVPGLIRAFEAASSRIPHDLVLAGKVGWQAQASLQALAESPVAGRLRRLDYVPASDLPALYAGADLLVHWSLYEGAGLTPLEALACGTAAIVSDGGALPELAGQVAPVVPLAAGPEALAEQIVSLLGDSDRRARIVAEGQALVSRLRWSRYAQHIVALYEEAAALASSS